MAGVQQRSLLTQRLLQDVAQGQSTAAGRERHSFEQHFEQHLDQMVEKPGGGGLQGPLHTPCSSYLDEKLITLMKTLALT